MPIKAAKYEKDSLKSRSGTLNVVISYRSLWEPLLNIRGGNIMKYSRPALRALKSDKEMFCHSGSSAGPSSGDAYFCDPTGNSPGNWNLCDHGGINLDDECGNGGGAELSLCVGGGSALGDSCNSGTVPAADSCNSGTTAN